MNYLVLGHGGHGKGTFCRLLEEVYGLRAMSSSTAALPYIYPSLVAAREELRTATPGVALPYANASNAYALRRSHRQLWKELISLLNTPDKTTLSRLLLAEADVYDGMRDVEEFEASRHLFDLIFWIDASKRVEHDPTMQIPRDGGMIYVNNNGPEEDLARIVARLQL